MLRNLDSRFLRGQYERLSVGLVVGSGLAVLAHLFTRDPSFVPLLHREWAAFPARWHFVGFKAYKLELMVLATALVMLLTMPLARRLRAYARAWWTGIASVLTPAVAVATFATVRWESGHAYFALSAGAVLVVLVFGTECWRRMSPQSLRAAEIHLRIPVLQRELLTEERWQPKPGDDPITDWNEDVIGRTAVVELLADHALRQNAPIVALQGNLGDGKSSVLNLLRLAVGGQAIVVSFSGWLPGSDATLATDLFRDIATECRKYIYVPRLRKAVLTYARAISGSVPHLAGLKELLPGHSQRDDIQDVREVLSRLPCRILVLIDEIDRMQKEELVVLLKVLRGAFTIPNVTFICAFSEAHVTAELEQSQLYLEKFFPVSVSLSPPSTDQVGRLFQARLTKTFEDEKWFVTDGDKAKFRESLQELWHGALAKLCTNLRQTGILINDILAAARPILREVNPLDLIVIETVRRFYPKVYRLVRANRLYLTYGGGGFTKFEYVSDEKRTEGVRHLDEQLKQELTGSEEPQVAQSLLIRLFPCYENIAGTNRHFQVYVRPTNEQVAEDEKRICAADYFPIYFRGAVPEEMFSNAELEQILSDLNGAASKTAVAYVFARVLNSIPAGHPKREDFLWKLNRASARFTDTAARDLAYAASEHAADYAYDRLNVGEAAQALNLVFTAAQKLSATPAAQRVLETAMTHAADDTFALRILEFTENHDRNRVLTNFTNINPPAVREKFMARMRQRYGPDRNAQEVSIQQGDWRAFRLWVQNSEEDCAIERDFWRRFVGRSRKRLAEAINFAFPSGWSWEQDPSPIVSVVFPTEEFRRLLREIPQGEPLDEVETKAMDRMERLVAGTWQGEAALWPQPKRRHAR